jgi:hypothetical protein
MDTALFQNIQTAILYQDITSHTATAKARALEKGFLNILHRKLWSLVSSNMSSKIVVWHYYYVQQLNTEQFQFMLYLCSFVL